jgi:DNA-binding NarL/FixJ family response regulator
MRKAKSKNSRPRPWSEGEVKLLRTLYPDNSTRDIANELGRTVAAVQNKASKLGLGKSIRVWSKRELNLLKKLYPGRTAQQVADQLRRPVQATRKKVVVLGLKKRRSLAKN